jgi:hypothetical protein
MSAILTVGFIILYSKMVFAMDFDAIISGLRPDKIPADWAGAPTKSALGYRWNDPNGENSVLFFKGDPADPDPTKREPYVIVLSKGQVVGRDGMPIIGAKVPE